MIPLTAVEVAFQFIVKNWRLAVSGVLLIALGVQSVRLTWTKHDLRNARSQVQAARTENAISVDSIKRLTVVLNQQNAAVTDLQNKSNAAQIASHNAVLVSLQRGKARQGIIDALVSIKPPKAGCVASDAYNAARKGL
jgi:hypothetical protein